MKKIYTYFLFILTALSLLATSAQAQESRTFRFFLDGNVLPQEVIYIKVNNSPNNIRRYTDANGESQFSGPTAATDAFSFSLGRESRAWSPLFRLQEQGSRVDVHFRTVYFNIASGVTLRALSIDGKSFQDIDLDENKLIVAEKTQLEVKYEFHDVQYVKKLIPSAQGGNVVFLGDEVRILIRFNGQPMPAQSSARVNTSWGSIAVLLNEKSELVFANQPGESFVVDVIRELQGQNLMVKKRFRSQKASLKDSLDMVEKVICLRTDGVPTAGANLKLTDDFSKLWWNSYTTNDKGCFSTILVLNESHVFSYRTFSQPVIPSSKVRDTLYLDAKNIEVRLFSHGKPLRKGEIYFYQPAADGSADLYTLNNLVFAEGTTMKIPMFAQQWIQVLSTSSISDVNSPNLHQRFWIQDTTSIIEVQAYQMTFKFQMQGDPVPYAHAYTYFNGKWSTGFDADEQGVARKIYISPGSYQIEVAGSGVQTRFDVGLGHDSIVVVDMGLMKVKVSAFITNPEMLFGNEEVPTRVSVVPQNTGLSNAVYFSQMYQDTAVLYIPTMPDAAFVLRLPNGSRSPLLRLDKSFKNHSLDVVPALCEIYVDSVRMQDLHYGVYQEDVSIDELASGVFAGDYSVHCEFPPYFCPVRFTKDQTPRVDFYKTTVVVRNARGEEMGFWVNVSGGNLEDPLFLACSVPFQLTEGTYTFTLSNGMQKEVKVGPNQPKTVEFLMPYTLNLEANIQGEPLTQNEWANVELVKYGPYTPETVELFHLSAENSTFSASLAEGSYFLRFNSITETAPFTLSASSPKDTTIRLSFVRLAAAVKDVSKVDRKIINYRITHLASGLMGVKSVYYQEFEPFLLMGETYKIEVNGASNNPAVPNYVVNTVFSEPDIIYAFFADTTATITSSDTLRFTAPYNSYLFQLRQANGDTIPDQYKSAVDLLMSSSKGDGMYLFSADKKEALLDYLPLGSPFEYYAKVRPQAPYASTSPVSVTAQVSGKIDTCDVIFHPKSRKIKVQVFADNKKEDAMLQLLMPVSNTFFSIEEMMYVKTGNAVEFLVAPGRYILQSSILRKEVVVGEEDVSVDLHFKSVYVKMETPQKQVRQVSTTIIFADGGLPGENTLFPLVVPATDKYQALLLPLSDRNYSLTWEGQSQTFSLSSLQAKPDTFVFKAYPTVFRFTQNGSKQEVGASLTLYDAANNKRETLSFSPSSNELLRVLPKGKYSLKESSNPFNPYDESGAKAPLLLSFEQKETLHHEFVDIKASDVSVLLKNGVGEIVLNQDFLVGSNPSNMLYNPSSLMLYEGVQYFMSSANEQKYFIYDGAKTIELVLPWYPVSLLVVDNESLKPIASASVKLNDEFYDASMTDRHGWITYPNQSGTTSMTITFPGYHDFIWRREITQTIKDTIRLKKQTAPLHAVRFLAENAGKLVDAYFQVGKVVSGKVSTTIAFLNSSSNPSANNNMLMLEAGEYFFVNQNLMWSGNFSAPIYFTVARDTVIKDYLSNLSFTCDNPNAIQQVFLQKSEGEHPQVIAMGRLNTLRAGEYKYALDEWMTNPIPLSLPKDKSMSIKIPSTALALTVTVDGKATSQMFQGRLGNVDFRFNPGESTKNIFAASGKLQLQVENDVFASQQYVDLLSNVTNEFRLDYAAFNLKYKNDYANFSGNTEITISNGERLVQLDQYQSFFLLKPHRQYLLTATNYARSFDVKGKGYSLELNYGKVFVKIASPAIATSNYPFNFALYCNGVLVKSEKRLGALSTIWVVGQEYTVEVTVDGKVYSQTLIAQKNKELIFHLPSRQMTVDVSDALTHQKIAGATVRVLSKDTELRLCSGVTNDLGRLSLPVVEGSAYVFEITHPHFGKKMDEFSLFSDSTLTVQMNTTTYTHFLVKSVGNDQFQEEGRVTIRKNGMQVQSHPFDFNCWDSVPLSPGDYAFEIIAPNLLPYRGAFTVGAGKDSLQWAYYSYKSRAVYNDGSTVKNLWYSLFNLQLETLIDEANADSVVSLLLPPGSYYLTSSKDENSLKMSNFVIVDAPLTDNYKINKLKITLTYEGHAIPFSEIQIAGNEDYEQYYAMTNAQGEAFFEMQDGNYTYVAFADPFVKRGDLSLSGEDLNLSLEIKPDKAMYDVHFMISQMAPTASANVYIFPEGVALREGNHTASIAVPAQFSSQTKLSLEEGNYVAGWRLNNHPFYYQQAFTLSRKDTLRFSAPALRSVRVISRNDQGHNVALDVEIYAPENSFGNALHLSTSTAITTRVNLPDATYSLKASRQGLQDLNATFAISPTCDSILIIYNAKKAFPIVFAFGVGNTPVLNGTLVIRQGTTRIDSVAISPMLNTINLPEGAYTFTFTSPLCFPLNGELLVSAAANMKYELRPRILDNVLQGDTLCTIAGKTIAAMLPRCLLTNLTYQWQYSANGTTAWRNLATSLNYTTTATDSIGFYRRIVIAGTLSDSSNAVALLKVGVENDSIGASQSVLSGAAPSAFENVGTLVVKYNLPHSYQWHKKATTASNWDTIANATQQNYQAPALTESQNYRRVIKLNKGCSFTSNTITVTVVPPTQIITPTVQTNEAANILAATATLNGRVTGLGNDTLKQRGFYYSTSNNFPNGQGTKVVVPASDTLAFSFNLTALSANTTYYFRAFAENSAGITYANIRSFTTLQSTGLQPQEEDYSIGLYPNPSTGISYLQIKGIQAKKVEIVDLSGHLIQSIPSSYLQNSKIQIDITKQPAGLFFVVITTEKETIVKKLYRN